MNQTSVTVGPNRTGIDMSPMDSKELIAGANAGVPSSPGDDQDLMPTRYEYGTEGERIGSVPPPATMKGAASAVVKGIKGERLTVFLDKLAERAAFERTGTRLYEGLLVKFQEAGSQAGGPTLADLREIHDDELAHFHLVARAIDGLGADPTAQTPSADIVGVMGLGLVQVVSDPRTTFLQALQAMLIAELTDTAGWALLVNLARSADEEELALQFEAARLAEERHLGRVRAWVEALTLAEATMP
jgi:hypothetical protein